jgi:hypothetical protein
MAIGQQADHAELDLALFAQDDRANLIHELPQSGAVETRGTGWV